MPTIFIPALGATTTVVYKEIFALWVSLTHLQSTRCLATFSTVTCCTLVQLPALTHEIVLTRTDVLTNISLAPMIDAHFKKERASVFIRVMKALVQWCSLRTKTCLFAI